MKIKLIKKLRSEIKRQPKVGSIGEVVSMRDGTPGDKATRQYLVKFPGRSGLLHCDNDEVEVLTK